MTDSHVQLRIAESADAERICAVIHAAFSARKPLDPPAPALSETVETIRDQLDQQIGLVAELVDPDSATTAIVGATLIKVLDDPDLGRVAKLRRVAVDPANQRNGIATVLVTGAGHIAGDLGCGHLILDTRAELPEVEKWWRNAGFVAIRQTEHGHVFGYRLPKLVEVPTADAMHQLGIHLAAIVQPGDLLVATGDLGAGKTTLTQGLGIGLDVEGPVISPTFVLSRIHHSRRGGPDLIHVDAYRLSSAAELADIDLDDTLSDSVTVVEWGEGLAEGLSPNRLEIQIARSDDPADDTRLVYFTGVGPRWDGVDWSQLDIVNTSPEPTAERIDR